MPFRMAEEESVAVIKVIGVGGGGGNAINTMVESKLAGVQFIAANTDADSLAQNRAPTRIQLGQTLVQQQPQQQSQGQSAFAGQGQQGQKGSGSFAETGQTEAEVTGAGMRLSTESTNDSGIDFYA